MQQIIWSQLAFTDLSPTFMNSDIVGSLKVGCDAPITTEKKDMKRNIIHLCSLHLIISYPQVCLIYGMETIFLNEKK